MDRLRAFWTTGPGRGVLAVVLAAVTLGAWTLASPIGAGPDDDFHLVSTWCAGPAADEFCEPGTTESTRVVPEALVQVACFAFEPERSAACQGDEFDWSVDSTVETSRGNFVGSYPPLYYAVTSLLAGEDIQASALGMRVLTLTLFLGITVGLYLLLPIARRPALVWGWLVTMVPLGLFLVGSNNPSAWAIIGVGSSWLALLGWFETEGRRKIWLGALFVVSVLMAAGARSDAAAFVGLGVVLVMVLTARRTRRWFLDAILPLVMLLVAVLFVFSARQALTGLGGFGGPTRPPRETNVPGLTISPRPTPSPSPEEVLSPGSPGTMPEPDTIEAGLSGFGLLAYNLLNAPFIWSGVWGQWGLGWLDTAMPAVVPLAGIAAFVAVGFAGMRSAPWRKTVAVALLVTTLWAVPVYVLQAGGNIVGEQVQPRYLLPMIVVLAGLMLLAATDRPLRLGFAQRWIVIAALAGAHFVALHMNLRRYVTGIDEPGVNLNSGAEWWWAGPIGPTAVWLIGSAAFVGLVIVSSRLLAGRQQSLRPHP